MKPKAPHNFPEEAPLLDVLDTKLGAVYFYNNIVVVEVKEGVNMSYRIGFPVLIKGLKIIGTKDWVYIANRINSYSLNPNDYKYLNKVPNLKGLAIVAPDEASRNSAMLEKNFVKMPFRVFSDTVKAYHWATEILKSETEAAQKD